VPEQAWFIPGRPGAPRGPLARYRPIEPTRAAKAYVQRLTRPGDLVVDLFCQGATVVGEAVAAGRRALGISVNPLLLVIARLGLGWLEANAVKGRMDADALNAAFTHLADSPKGNVPLHRYMASLYRSACPACGATGVAAWFAWDRDGDYPFRKAVHCPRCEDVQEGPADSEDNEHAHHIPPRGLAYFYALDRVAPPDHPARAQTARLVALYTPRNLSALTDLAMRLEGLEADEETKVALTGLLLDCFDTGSSLDPYGEKRSRPRTLRTPARYLERNVWLCFEQGLSRLLAEESLSAYLGETNRVPAQPTPTTEGDADADRGRPVADVDALVRREVDGYALVSHAARDVQEIIPTESTALVFVDPPRPDGVFWALSALWAGWLWDSPSARALRPFLRRRRFDWDWHWHVLRVALKAAGPLLTPRGHLLTLFSDPDDALLESVCLAASGAGYALEGWGYSSNVGHRLVWSWRGAASTTPADVEALQDELLSEAERAAVNALQERGEPTEWRVLHGSALARLADRGLLARTATIPKHRDGPQPLSLINRAAHRASESASIVQLADREGAEESPWWLADAGQAAQPPLADRVETRVRELLIQRPTWDVEELVEAIYAHFPGHLTPDLTLVSGCIDSYSTREDTILRLRPEDAPARRAAEIRALREDLAELGKRLGFEIRERGNWDMRWLGEGQEAYALDISATAALGRHLLVERATDQEPQRCLVVPGGRASLVSLKLQRDPRLARAVEADGWQFIKFRHVRRLVTEENLDRHALKTVLGLDPIVEQDAAQIPLF
jgi:hypothetical protein